MLRPRLLAQATTTVSKGAATRTDTTQVQPNTGSTANVQNTSGVGSVQVSNGRAGSGNACCQQGRGH